jgi:hypothetical protein
MGQVGLGVIKLITVGGCGFWALYDTIMIGCGSMKDADGNSLK